MFYPEINTQTQFQLDEGEMLLGIKIGNRNCQVCPCCPQNMFADDGLALEFSTAVHLSQQGNLFFGDSTGSINKESFYSILRAFAFAPDPTLSLANICRESLKSLGMQPKDVLTVLFEEILRRAEQLWSKTVIGAVVAVPDYFEKQQIKEWKELIVKSGLSQVYLLPVDGASIMEFKRMQKERELTKPVLFYRLGDTHCTATIAQFDGDKVRVIDKAVNTEIGGRYLNEHILAYWQEINNLSANHFIDNEKLFVAAKLAAYQAQKKIPSKFLFKKILDGPINAQISLEIYHELVEPTILSSIDFTKAFLAKNKIAAADIGDVVLMGGASHIPLVYIEFSRLCVNAKPHLLAGYPLAARGAAMMAQAMLK